MKCLALLGLSQSPMPARSRSRSAGLSPAIKLAPNAIRPGLLAPQLATRATIFGTARLASVIETAAFDATHQLDAPSEPVIPAPRVVPPSECPGYIVDHVIPLERRGPDKLSNMQWQSVEEAKAKDRIE
jgi:hypothetical protein